jgi:RND superfamily putative drug exporter
VNVFELLGGFVYRRRWPVLVVWGILLAFGAFFAPQLGGRLQGGGFDGAGTESERVQDLLIEEFGVSPASLVVVFDGDGLPARGERFREEERQALEGLRDIPELSYITTYASTGDRRFISGDGEKSYAVVAFEVPADESEGLVDDVRREVRSGTLNTYVTGAPAVYLDIQTASNEDVRQAEKYAFPLAVVVLVLAFGTLVAAGVPVLIGGASVVVTLSTLYFVAGSFEMSVFVLTLSTMLGLGLGIDYALFAVSRFREELESYTVAESVRRTVATAGRSIFFSGTAVLIGLSGLLFFPYMFLRSIGAAGMIVVLVSVCAALTLLPALLGVLGHRINSLAIRRGSGSPGLGFWGRSAELVMRRPIPVILLAAVVLGTLLWPVSHMKVGIPEATVLPQEYESRVGDDILKRDFDYAGLNPMEIVMDTSADPLTPEGLREIEELGERVAATEGVEGVESIYTLGERGARAYAGRVSGARKEAEAEAERRVDRAVEDQLDEVRERYGFVPPGAEERVREEAERRVDKELERRVPELPEGISANGSVTPEGVANFLELPEARRSEELPVALDNLVAGDRALIQAETGANPYTGEARIAVERVRDLKPPPGVSFLVGGLSAGQLDFIKSVYGKVPYAAAFVLGVTYLVLLFTFRSVFLPLKAVIVNILSLTASFGAMVFVFQDGNLSGVLGFTPLGFVDATLPVLMFCTVFGVSMDYEVFLLSRVREAYENGDSNTASVAKGLTSTAGIITSAAAIIIIVTGAFAFTGIVLTKAVGLGLAVAVLVDATIIRVLLVPATMRILGDWNWWPGGRRSVFKQKG